MTEEMTRLNWHTHKHEHNNVRRNLHVTKISQKHREIRATVFAHAAPQPSTRLHDETKTEAGSRIMEARDQSSALFPVCIEQRCCGVRMHYPPSVHQTHQRIHRVRAPHTHTLAHSHVWNASSKHAGADLVSFSYVPHIRFFFAYTRTEILTRAHTRIETKGSRKKWTSRSRRVRLYSMTNCSWNVRSLRSVIDLSSAKD